MSRSSSVCSYKYFSKTLPQEKGSKITTESSGSGRVTWCFPGSLSSWEGGGGWVSLGQWGFYQEEQKCETQQKANWLCESPTVFPGMCSPSLWSNKPNLFSYWHVPDDLLRFLTLKMYIIAFCSWMIFHLIYKPTNNFNVLNFWNMQLKIYKAYTRYVYYIKYTLEIKNSTSGVIVAQ